MSTVRVLIAARQGVCSRVLATRPVDHRECIAKKLTDPCVLWNRRETLVEEMLQAAVVGSDGERPRPEVRPLVTDGLDERRVR